MTKRNIQRAAVVKFLEDLGIDPKSTLELNLKFGPDVIHCEAIVADPHRSTGVHLERHTEHQWVSIADTVDNGT